AVVEAKGAEIVTNDPGDLNTDGFNESEGCMVLRGKGPVELTYRKWQQAGFAPAFKIMGWQGVAPTRVKADGKDVPVIAHVVGGNLILQVQGRLEGAQGKLEIGKEEVRTSEVSSSNVRHRTCQPGSRLDGSQHDWAASLPCRNKRCHGRSPATCRDPTRLRVHRNSANLLRSHRPKRLSLRRRRGGPRPSVNPTVNPTDARNTENQIAVRRSDRYAPAPTTLHHLGRGKLSSSV